MSDVQGCTAITVLLEWVILNCVCGDSELAIISNVSNEWRRALAKVVRGLAPSGSPPLLLTSFVRRLQGLEHGQQAGINENDAFCLAWFASEGIRCASRPPDSAIEDENGNIYEATGFFEGQASLSESNAATSMTDPFVLERSDIDRRLSNKRDSKPNLLPVVEEWRGYHAFDVLNSFGYTNSFLHELLRAIRSSLFTSATNVSLQQRGPPGSTDAVVRGATVARPESFCLCYDEERNKGLSLETTSADSEMAAMRAHENCQALRRREQRKRELQREVLPRIIETLESSSKPSKCVQFLNESGDNAVCMMTPTFACGPVSEPITFFCVGIATEDGCFLSGLYHRFEFGHLYPPNEFFEVTEQSPICMATERWEPETTRSEQEVPDDSENSESGFESDLSCDCVFQGVCEKITDMDREPETIARGRLGPGDWHCYVGIFDGCNSRIRVDGVEELVQSNYEASRPYRAILDGLTIGSDHCFGLSLCCGQSPAEGQGALAEVAVFHGLMSQIDIEHLEGRLMQKHSIACPPPDFRDINENKRKAQGLFLKTTDPSSQASVPLRYMAQNAQVAWRQFDPVTGTPRKVGRIGVRKDADSSDW